MVTTGTLHRDITEALLRLKLARSQRDRKEEQVCEKRLNWLLDRLAAKGEQSWDHRRTRAGGAAGPLAQDRRVGRLERH